MFVEKLGAVNTLKHIWNGNGAPEYSVFGGPRTANGALMKYL